MPREMTPKETKVWNKFKQSVLLADMETQISLYRRANLGMQVRFGQRYSIAAKGITQKQHDEIDEIRRKVAHLKRLIAFAEEGKIGVEFTAGKEMNFVAPPGTTDEQMLVYTSLQGLPLIIVGIVIVLAVIGYIYYLRKLNSGREKMLKRLVLHNNDRFCKDKDTPECRAWLKERETEGYSKNDSQIAGLEKAMEEVGKSMLGGAKWGIAIAIPLVLAYFYFQREKKISR